MTTTIIHPPISVQTCEALICDLMVEIVDNYLIYGVFTHDYTKSKDMYLETIEK